MSYIEQETAKFDVQEKVNILFKNSMGFSSTKEDFAWYDEGTYLGYNNYVRQNEILLDKIPDNPTYVNVNISNANLNVNDFTSSNDSGIKEDNTGSIRKYTKLILDSVPSSDNNSYYKLDQNGENVLKDAIQFNTNWSTGTDKLYSYTLTNQSFINTDPNAPDEINQDSTGGNWFFDIKNGAIFFPDYSSSICNNTTNKPILTFYKYIGKKGLNNLNISGGTTNSSNYYNLLQIASTNISSTSDVIINDTIYQLINDISLTMVAQKSNSKYKLLLNFNYLSSNYYDTLLNIALCYKINNGSENIIGEYILGTENTSFLYNFFSSNFYKTITSNITDNINFYIKGKIKSNNSFSYSSLDNVYKPKILLSLAGNILNVEEINN